MRPSLLQLSILAGLLAPVTAFAQVSVNQGALDQLAPAAPVRRPAAPAPAAKPVVPAPAPFVAPTAAPAKPAPTTPIPITMPAEPPLVPYAPPSPPLLPPPVFAVPTRPEPPPPPPVVVEKAVGEAHPIDRGMRITFGPGSADLNAATEGALEAVAEAARRAPTQPVNVTAHADGTPEDPSTPRRLALARGLAARAVLVNHGIVSTRIYVRAAGPEATEGGPADRVDVVIGPTNAEGSPSSAESK